MDKYLAPILCAVWLAGSVISYGITAKDIEGWPSNVSTTVPPVDAAVMAMFFAPMWPIYWPLRISYILGRGE